LFLVMQLFLYGAMWDEVFNRSIATCSMLKHAHRLAPVSHSCVLDHHSAHWFTLTAQIDEGTSMVKMAATEADTPLEGRFIHASIDGEELTSDFYLQLAGNFTREWRGRLAAAESGDGDGGYEVALPPMPPRMRELRPVAALGLE
jgi:hypothetical protein